MRAMMRIALATTALAVGGLLTISVSDTAFAKTSKHVTHHKKATSASETAPEGRATSIPGLPPRTVNRDRTANPGRGDPDKTPQNATTEPF